MSVDRAKEKDGNGRPGRAGSDLSSTSKRLDHRLDEVKAEPGPALDVLVDPLERFEHERKPGRVHTRTIVVDSDRQDALIRLQRDAHRPARVAKRVVH